LSLVRAVVHLHNGKVVLRDNDPGLCVQVTLPRILSDLKP
jgi:signal transduction histidine kinase